MAFERLSPLDASFLHIEDAVTHMHIGSVALFEGPPPAYSEIREMVASKLPLVRRYRQVVREVPFDLGRPVWADDPFFNIEYHLRHTGLPAPGGDGELCNLVGRLMSQQLDRNRPLWEMWIVEGLPGGEWALVSKVHHCMVDGVSGSDLLALILDPTPEPAAPPAETLPWVPALPPAGWELALDAVTSMMGNGSELARAVRARTRLPRRALGPAREVLAAMRAAAGSIRSETVTSLNGPLGPHRRWAPAYTTVDAVKEIRHRLGGTFNDVVLAAITRGFRDVLEKRGELPELPLRSLVPVSVRGRNEGGLAVGDGTLANKVSGVFVDLPVHLEDPISRLHSIAAQMAGVKETRQALAGEALTSLTGFAPPLLLSMAGRLLTKMPQRSVNTVTTNVPGPQLPLYAAGRRMTRAYPFVPLGMSLHTAVAIFSYDGHVGFGVTGDFDHAPDVEVLAHGIEAGVAELRDADPDGVIVNLAPVRANRSAGEG